MGKKANACEYDKNAVAPGCNVAGHTNYQNIKYSLTQPCFNNIKIFFFILILIKPGCVRRYFIYLKKLLIFGFKLIPPFGTAYFQRWHSWSRHCASIRKVVGSIPDSVIGIFY
jgi:hypothetical protein